MFEYADLPTLRLCSLLQSLAYGLIFGMLWLRRRRETYLAYWCGSSALYAAALIVFELSPGFLAALRNPVGYGMVAASDLLILSGLRRFDGRPPFAAWMVIPVGAAMAAVALPPLTIGDAATAAAISRILGAAALGGCMISCAWGIITGARGGTALPRRIVAAALVGYIPGYAIAIAATIWNASGMKTLAVLPVIQDQILLPILNLGLLATPWERALRGLRESVLRDALTGAWNRTALKQREVGLALPATTLFLIDIDHFKRINDTFGHAAGDAVLVALSRGAQAIAAERDGMFVRLGGDEFVLVAPTADQPDAHELAERLRAITIDRGDDIPPHSISIGIGRVLAGEGKLSQALGRADRSLYRAKERGRDQVAA